MESVLASSTGIVLGIWLILSPWVLGVSGLTVVLWNNVLIGLAIVLRNLWRIFGR